MMKKLICSFLAVIVIMTQCISYASEYDLVKSLGIMVGYDNGDFGGEDNLTRAQFAKIVVTMVDKDFTPYSSVSPYSDVVSTHWASSYIAYASDLGYLSGYPDGSFKPDNEVNFEEASKVLLCMLDYDSSGSGDWAATQINMAKKIGILKNVEALIGQSVNRFNAAKMVQNTMLLKQKDKQNYLIESLGYKYFQDAVIITDKSTSENKVLTSAGAFLKNGMISQDDLFKCGDLIVDEYDNVAAFLPKNQTVKSYVVKAVLPNSIATFEDSQQIDLEDDVKAYLGEKQSTFSEIKSQIKTGDRISLYMDSSNKTEYIGIEKDVIDGPFTNIGSSFVEAYSLNSNTKVMRDGTATDISKIKDYDVCYYIKDSNTALAYSKKSTGVYENAFPNKVNPTSISLSGVTYEIGNNNAFKKLASDGNIAFGDTITILFDKDDKIADVISSSEFKEQKAYVIDTGLKEKVNEKNEKVYEYYAKLVSIDGTELEYITDKSYESLKGNMVNVSFIGGKAKLSVLSRVSGVSGIFNWGNKAIGNEKLAEDVKIIDVTAPIQYGAGKYAEIFPQRINNVNLGNSSVLYFEKNNNNEIKTLVLNNVTNDMYSFGIVTKADNQSGYTAVLGNYDIMVGGEQRHYTTNSVLFNIGSGQPALFDFEGADIKGIKKLIAVTEKITSIDNGFVYTSGGSYKLSDKYIIYKRESVSSSDYSVISLSDAISNNYKLTAYYDKDQAMGGKIRVIIAN